MDHQGDSRYEQMSAKTLVSAAVLLMWLATFMACGVISTPALFSTLGMAWEAADTAESYAIGHRNAGLWSTEKGQEVIAEARATKQFLYALGGTFGACIGAVPVVIFLLSPHRVSEE